MKQDQQRSQSVPVAVPAKKEHEESQQMMAESFPKSSPFVITQ
jgi:hypothetical protein